MRAGSGASQFNATSDVTNDAPPALGILWTTAAVAPRTRLLPRLPGPGCPRRRWQWTPALLLSHRAVAPLLPASSRARATASSGTRRRSAIVRVSPRWRGRGARDPDRAMSATRAEAVDVVAERPSDARPGGAFARPHAFGVLGAFAVPSSGDALRGGRATRSNPRIGAIARAKPRAPRSGGGDDVRCGETGRALSSRRSGFAASSSPSEASPVSGRPSI